VSGPDLLGADDMDRPGFEGAKYICSPSPRGAVERAGMWQELRLGTLDIISSDHGGSRAGCAAAACFFPDSYQSSALRRPSLCVLRLITRLVCLGTIAPGTDADLVLFDPVKQVVLTNSLMQHATDYTPCEGIRVIGWPLMTIARGALL
jgi:dihydropyrimidinase